MRTVGRTFKKARKPGDAKPSKEEIMRMLTDKEIAFDKSMTMEELIGLLPKE